MNKWLSLIYKNILIVYDLSELAGFKCYLGFYDKKIFVLFDKNNKYNVSYFMVNTFKTFKHIPYDIDILTYDYSVLFTTNNIDSHISMDLIITLTNLKIKRFYSYRFNVYTNFISINNLECSYVRQHIQSVFCEYKLISIYDTDYKNNIKYILYLDDLNDLS